MTDKKCFCGENHDGEKGHHCPDWDFMFVRPTDKEADCCTCNLSANEFEKH